MLTFSDAHCSIKIRLEEKGPFAGMWELVSLHTAPAYRRRGEATRALEQVCKDADLVGRSIHVTARPVEADGISPVALREFYEKFGFENYPGVGRAAQYSMIRKPQK